MSKEKSTISIKSETKAKLLEIKIMLMQNEKKNVTWDDVIRYLLEKQEKKNE
ncbi:MAG: hypothetical protein QW184_01300 [Nanopusillaceae archaeon]